jgi:hypothetical protein
MRNEVDELIEKAKKKGGPNWKKLKGAVEWTGKQGFTECVAALSKKHSVDSAKRICGALKREARNTGVLAKKHMGRLEKKKNRRK